MHSALTASLRSCRLQLASPSSTSIPISIAIFKRGPAGSLKDQVATSGPYADAISGVITPETHLEAGLYVIVPSTYAAKVEESFNINVYATRKIELTQI
jgi:calpain-7